MRTTMVSQGNILLAPVIAWWLCAPKYLVGTMSLGEVAQVTAAFVIVQAALELARRKLCWRCGLSFVRQQGCIVPDRAG